MGHGTGQLLTAIRALMKDLADKASAANNPEAAAELIMAIFAPAMTMESMIVADEKKSHRALKWKDQLMASIKRKRRMDQSSSYAQKTFMEDRIQLLQRGSKLVDLSSDFLLVPSKGNGVKFSSDI